MGTTMKMYFVRGMKGECEIPVTVQGNQTNCILKIYRGGEGLQPPLPHHLPAPMLSNIYLSLYFFLVLNFFIQHVF